MPTGSRGQPSGINLVRSRAAGGELRRELLVFWAVGLFGGETLPVTEVWDGVVLDGERRILFETGGYLSDLGDVYVIDQSLRHIPD